MFSFAIFDKSRQNKIPKMSDLLCDMYSVKVYQVPGAGSEAGAGSRARRRPNLYISWVRIWHNSQWSSNGMAGHSVICTVNMEKGKRKNNFLKTLHKIQLMLCNITDKNSKQSCCTYLLLLLPSRNKKLKRIFVVHRR